MSILSKNCLLGEIQAGVGPISGHPNLSRVHTAPSLLPTKNPPCDVHFSDSIPVLVVCLVFVFVVFLFFFVSFVDVSLLSFYCS